MGRATDRKWFFGPIPYTINSRLRVHFVEVRKSDPFFPCLMSSCKGEFQHMAIGVEKLETINRKVELLLGVKLRLLRLLNVYPQSYQMCTNGIKANV